MQIEIMIIYTQLVTCHHKQKMCRLLMHRINLITGGVLSVCTMYLHYNSLIYQSRISVVPDFSAAKAVELFKQRCCRFINKLRDCFPHSK